MSEKEKRGTAIVYCELLLCSDITKESFCNILHWTFSNEKERKRSNGDYCLSVSVKFSHTQKFCRSSYFGHVN